jgi:hypothetical protein
MTTFENLTFTDDMPLDLLRELIHDGIIPETFDPAYSPAADWNSFCADMANAPLDLPTDAEILEMAKAHGLAALPF